MPEFHCKLNKEETKLNVLSNRSGNSMVLGSQSKDSIDGINLSNKNRVKEGWITEREQRFSKEKFANKIIN